MTTISNLEAHGIPVTAADKVVKTTTVVQNVDQLRSLLDHGFDEAGREAHYQALFGGVSTPEGTGASTAQRLAAQRPFHAPPLHVCLQVNLAAEGTKGGVAPAALPALAAAVALLPRLQLRGLMCIPPEETQPARQRAWFAQLRALRDELNAGGLQLDTLSMGMSADFEAAIAEGSTIVRIGTALFGARPLQ